MIWGAAFQDPKKDDVIQARKNIFSSSQPRIGQKKFLRDLREKLDLHPLQKWVSLQKRATLKLMMPIFYKKKRKKFMSKARCFFFKFKEPLSPNAQPWQEKIFFILQAKYFLKIPPSNNWKLLKMGPHHYFHPTLLKGIISSQQRITVWRLFIIERNYLFQL